MEGAEIVADILAHHGVKGQKWGVRKAVDTTVGTTTAKPSRQVRKADKKFEKSINLSTWIKINNLAATATNNNHIARINNKPEYRKASARGDFHDASKPITQKYYKEHQDAFLSEVRKAADSLGTNASGTRKYQISNDVNGNWSVSTTEVKHADSSFTVKVITNDLGEIIKLEVLGEMAQSEGWVNGVLAHHGTKGMKWGVRKSAAARVGAVKAAKARRASSAVTVVDKKKKVKTYGGTGRPAHPDAVRARSISQVGKKSGLKALSNEELRAYNERLNLEQNAKRLTQQDSSAGKKFVRKMLLRKDVQTTGKDVGMGIALKSAKVRRVAAIGATALAL